MKNINKALKGTLIATSVMSISCFADDSGETQSLFNGKDLSGWKGLTEYWSVKDGVIVGETTPERKTGGTFLIWQGGEVEDFEITLKARYEGNNSGLQYRSSIENAESFTVNGYQADLHPKHDYFGMMYHQGEGRKIVAKRFQQVEVDAKGATKVVTEFGDKNIKWDATQWHELRVVAVGNRMIHQINGVTTIDVTDNHSTAKRSGILALQLHGGPSMRVEFKDINLRQVSGDEADALLQKTLKEKEVNAYRMVVDMEPKASSATAIDFLGGKSAQWIWSEKEIGNTTLNLTKSFKLPEDVVSAHLFTACDDEMKCWVNGSLVGESKDWKTPIKTSVVLDQLKPGTNLIAIEAKNDKAKAGFVFKLILQKKDGSVEEIVSDVDWKASTDRTAKWSSEVAESAIWAEPLKSEGVLGSAPWGDFGLTQKKETASQITTLPGFEVEELFTFPASMGSKVSLTIDDQGRFYASDQYGEGLHRVTVNDEAAHLLIEKVPLELDGAQGVAWQNGSLYYYGRNSFKKLSDSDGDGMLDVSEDLPAAVHTSEHGNHAVRVTNEKDSLYLVAGNNTPLPSPELRSRSRVQSWSEDLLLKREWDARGHARGVMAPGGYFVRYDIEDKKNEIISIGYRNQYGVALNRFGDMFTYDADMEWDMGTPWYRPTRINFVVSGSDYGWRAGSGKWPTYYEDSLPPVVDIGPGSPTGVISGLGAKYPAKYQDAVYALDWTFGTMYAIHWKFDGAGYTAEKEVFCHGAPLPLTDAVVGKDGALYFIVGGRKAESRFCRIRYTGEESTADVRLENAELPELHQQRRSLEIFHGVKEAKAVATAWPYLSSKDRWLRNAARVAIESQPVASWEGAVFAEKNPQALITSAVALARMGDKSQQDKLLGALLELNPTALSQGEFLGLMRAYALTFTRMGKPSDAMSEAVIAELEGLLPQKNDEVNTELVRVLVYLEAPSVITKTMALIAAPHQQVVPNWEVGLISRNKNYGGPVTRLLNDYPPVQKLGYAFMLRNMKEGWTLEQRRAYIMFINSTAKHPGGRSYTKFLANLRSEVLNQLSAEDRKALNDVSNENYHTSPKFPIHPPKGPGQKWSVAKARPFVSMRSLQKANLVNGRSLFHATACAACHRFNGLGGDIGPDLSMVRSKFTPNYLLESIIDPSKVISDQYSSKIVTLKDGRVFNGIVIPREEVYDIYATTKTSEEVKPTSIVFEDVDTIVDAPHSQMPTGLINGMNGEEIRDMIGYLMSAGLPNE